MQRLALFLPTIILIIAACSRPVPPPRIAWRRSGYAQPQGYRVALLPTDVRVSFKGRSSQNELATLWSTAETTGEAMAEALPEYLERSKFNVNRRVTWNGTVIDSEGGSRRLITEKQMARVMSALAFFAKDPNDKPLKHFVAPGALAALVPESELSLYIASWHTVRMETNTTGKTVAQVIGVVVAVVLVAVFVAVIAAALSGGKGSSGKSRSGRSSSRGSRSLRSGSSRSRIHHTPSFRAGTGRGSWGSRSRSHAGSHGAWRSRSRYHGGKTPSVGNVARHLARRSSRSHAKHGASLLRLINLTARVTARTLRLIYHVNMMTDAAGMVTYEIPEASLVPQYAHTLTAEQLMNSNRFLGILDGFSPLAPLFRKPGHYIAYVLINNRTGQVVWDSQIFIPQGTKELKFKEVLSHLFSSIPRAVLPKKPAPSAAEPGAKPADPTAPTLTPPVKPEVKPAPVTPSAPPKSDAIAF